MGRHKTRRRINKKEAIRNALGRLGWNAGGKDVAVLLASFGIEVSPGLVHKVKTEALKETSRLRRLRTRARLDERHWRIPYSKKVPDRR